MEGKHGWRMDRWRQEVDVSAERRKEFKSLERNDEEIQCLHRDT